MEALLRRSATALSVMSADVLMLIWGDGLQGRSRRNAWSAMVEDSKRSRDRVSAEDALRATPDGATVAPGVRAAR